MRAASSRFGKTWALVRTWRPSPTTKPVPVNRPGGRRVMSSVPTPTILGLTLASVSGKASAAPALGSAIQAQWLVDTPGQTPCVLFNGLSMSDIVTFSLGA